MRGNGIAYILVLLASSAAHAQQLYPGVDQHAAGVQTAGNSIEIGTLEGLTDDYMSEMLNFAVTGNLSQNGTNTINSVVYGGDLGKVVQRFDGIQSVQNSIALETYDASGHIKQSGSNVAGSVTANSIEFADQLLGANGRQLVLNSAEFAILYGSVDQYGVNVANNAKAALAIGTATQIIDPGAQQRVDNRLEVAAMSVVSAAVQQRGENFGNVMMTETVDRVVRTFAGDQTVHNVVVLGDGLPGTIVQSGNNVANLIMASNIGSLQQYSTGNQVVINEVFDAQGHLVSGGNITQTADNWVNMIVLTMPAEGGNGGVISVEQAAEYPQSATGSGGGSQTGNSLTVDR